jgi:hypothetical protein
MLQIHKAKMKLKILAFILISSTTIFSQSLPTVIPPSPEATQLAKFVDMPVSLYNGTPNINVPIYTVNSGNITIPISLSYHAKGIQVAEKASRVGLGWTLNAGGAITRQIRGKADESSDGYYWDDHASDFTTNSLKRNILYNDDANNMADFYPDLFIFNFMGYSGKFIINQVTKQPVQQTFSDIKIQHFMDSGNIFGFIITTPDGTKYYFGSAKDKVYYRKNYKYSTDSSGLQPLTNEEPNYFDTWYLDLIVTPLNQTITFSYEEEDVIFTDINKIGKTSHTNFINYSTTKIFQNQLKEITFNGGKVIFNKSILNREDLYGGRVLDNIEVYREYDFQSHSYEMIKQVKFKYFYTTSNDNNQQTVLFNLKVNNTSSFFNGATDNYYATKRLFLEYVEEINRFDPSDKIVTKFIYNPILLPNRFSNATDNWGYFNGKNNNNLYAFLGTDRTVDTIKSEAGILKKIEHSTGGFTEFIYEQNRVIPQAYFKDLMIQYNNPLNPKLIWLPKDSSFYNSSQGYYQTPQPFEIKRRTSINFNVEFDNNNCSLNGPAQSGCRYSVFLTTDTGTILNQLVLGNTENIVLFEGNYHLRVVPNPSYSHNPYLTFDDDEQEFIEQFFSVTGTYKEQDILDSDELLVAGKRIKKIIKSDGINSVIEKEFEYKNDQGFSSGKTFSIPAFYYAFNINGVSYGVGSELMNGGNGPATNFTGGNLGYSQVTEIQSSVDGNIKKVSTFTNFDNTGEYYKVPYHLPNDLEWARGMPLTVKYYNFKNGSYTKVKEEKNTYHYFGYECSLEADMTCLSNSTIDPDAIGINNTYPEYLVSSNKVKIPMYQFGTYWDDYIPTCSPLTPDCYRTAYFLGGRFNLYKTEEINYFDSGNLTTISQYNYGISGHYQLKSQSVSTSNGKNKFVSYLYPHDLQMANSQFAQELIDKNMVNIPLITKSYYGTYTDVFFGTNNINEKLSEQETQYKDWDNGTGVLLFPEIIKSSKGDNLLENRIKYNEIDIVNGNPLEVQQESGMPISYIWGYNKTQPVAKLENIAYNDIPSNLITAIQISSNTGNESALLTELDALRTNSNANIQNAIITTYTYKPLIGVSTITDPKGDRITYHYDGFNRLEKVTDKEGNILSENKYHYRTQN